MTRIISACLVTLCIFVPSAFGNDPLHVRIDKLIEARADGPVSDSATDSEFVRRVYLDFAGRTPTRDELLQFLNDKQQKRRTRLIDKLLDAPEYAIRMSESFDVMLMERLGEHDAWKNYLRTSFKENKPWNTMVNEILGARSNDKKSAGAAFWISKRLENYGQNPVDYPALTRDIGRLFLGRDYGCAQCHDHLTVHDYKQRDFQGLFAFIKNVSLKRDKMPAVMERPTTTKIKFASVFTGERKETGPRVPDMNELAIPNLKKTELYLVKPDRRKKIDGVVRFSTLAALAKTLPAKENQAFNRNIVNRLWFLLMGRGLVHPLDMHHGKNPPSHPKLLDLLAREFVAHKYDLKWMLRELALTKTYQRSSTLPKGVDKVPHNRFRTAIQRRLSAEQLLRSMLHATGEKNVKGGATFLSKRSLFLKAFADAPRDPDGEFNPTLKAALFLLNGDDVTNWLQRKPGNLVDRLVKLKDNRSVANQLYMTVLSRRPTEPEIEATSAYLGSRKSRRTTAIRNLAWALLASTEFCVNH